MVDRLVKENPTLMPAELMTEKVREFTRNEGIKTLEIQESNKKYQETMEFNVQALKCG
jgi:hypothetical protein